MKIKIVGLLFLFGIVLHIYADATWSRQPFNGRTPGDALNDSIDQANEIQAERDQKANADAQAQRLKESELAAEKEELARQNYVPRDPWRKFGTQTNNIKEDGDEFCGKILEVQPEGVRISGGYSSIFNARYYSQIEDSERNTEFFVANFPFSVAEDELIDESQHLMAKYVGTYTYTTVQDGSRTIRKLDYGTPCDEPEWYLKQQELAAEKAREAWQAAQEAAQIKILAAKQKAFKIVAMLATNGEAGMQFSLGIRYLKGDGCETNRDAALYWLQKSAAAGYVEASNKLATLKPIDIASEK